ncbi:MAG: hypothetical protein KAS32_21700 [Candidatus Peribacteraceae bacterium]|nr:hypothetical protein [Candidatus Peribacteraceae bacterium]
MRDTEHRNKKVLYFSPSSALVLNDTKLLLSSEGNNPNMNFYFKVKVTIRTKHKLYVQLNITIRRGLV